MVWETEQCCFCTILHDNLRSWVMQFVFVGCPTGHGFIKIIAEITARFGTGVPQFCSVDSELCHLLWAISVRSWMLVACGSKSWLCMLVSDSAVHPVINYYIPCLHVEEHTKRFLRIFIGGHGCWWGYSVAKVFQHDKTYIFCSVTSDSFWCQ